jgi:hypothetical protein
MIDLMNFLKGCKVVEPSGTSGYLEGNKEGSRDFFSVTESDGRGFLTLYIFDEEMQDAREIEYEIVATNKISQPRPA